MSDGGLPREVLVFSLGGQRYALWAEAVRELVRAVAIVPLPRAPAMVEGVINLRGKVVPVLDLRGRFGVPAKPVEPGDHLIIAEVAGNPGPRRVAIRADRALDLVRLDPARIEEARALQSAGPYIAGVARLSEGLALIHDLRTFLSAGESASLDRALAAEAPA